jgi:hypothetical protein
MMPMSTEATPQPADHFVPETEPPVGTVASFHYRFASGAYSNTGFMLHTPGGWSDSPERPARFWEEMVDLEARNAGVQQRTPGSTAVAVSLEVRIHVTPPVDRPADRARLVKLEHAVYCAAERLGIPTEGASHAELVAALENLVFIARSV